MLRTLNFAVVLAAWVLMTTAVFNLPLSLVLCFLGGVVLGEFYWRDDNVVL